MDADYGLGQKKLGIYLIGFILCTVLTLIAFGVIMVPSFSKTVTLAIIYLAALIQFFIQVICFLRLTTSGQQGLNNVLCILFTFIILVTIILFSYWIMWSSNYYMTSI